MGGISRFGVSIESNLLDKFDKSIGQKRYSTRSEAIRDLIRDFLVSEQWEMNAEAVGVLSLVYSHGSRELQDVLAGIQHKHLDAIISSTHVHLDAHNCLEVVILKGKSSLIKQISEELTSTRKVKHGKLLMTTTGLDLD